MKMGRKKRTPRMCEEVGCHRKATHWYRFAYGERHFVCERHFREMDEVYDEIARKCSFRYDRGVLLQGGDEDASVGQNG